MDNDYPPDFPETLKQLLEAVTVALGALFTLLMLERLTVLAWQAEMERLLARYHMAAYMAGVETPTLLPDDRQTIQAYYANQLTYLDNFAGEIILSGLAGAALAHWAARAKMYGGAISALYWSGKTKGLNLPAHPGEGSECMSNCRCMWEIKTLDEASGNYDAYWRLDGDNPDGRNCQTCLGRSRDWNPLAIRGGVY